MRLVGGSASPAVPVRASRSPVLIGRERELGLLVQTAIAPPSVVIVEGEAGIGKSRLIGELFGTAELSGRHLLLGHCHRLREPFPLGPVIEALRGARSSLSKATLSPLIGVLAPLLPELSHVLPAQPLPLEDPRAERHRLFRALRELLEALGPTVCALEDLHWCDEGTIEFLSYLVSDLPKALALVISCRPQDLGPSSSVFGLTTSVSTDIAVHAIELCPLDAEQVGRLMRAVLGTEDISPEVASRLHELSAGIPFAVEEVLGVFQEQGGLDQFEELESATILEDLDVPRALRHSILERMAPLSDDARLIAHSVAVAGGPVDEVLIAKVADLSPARSAKGLVQALARALVVETDEGLYGFRHAMAAQAVYEEISGPVRRTLHLRAARALESGSLPLPLARIAYHYKQANRPGRRTHYTEAAADAAIALGDDRTAAGLLEEVLREPSIPRAARARMAIRLGRATIYDASPQRAISILECAVEEPMPVGMRGELRLYLAGLLCHSGDGSSWRDHMCRAAEELRRRPEMAVHAMVNLALPALSADPLHDHLTWLERALQVAARTEDVVARTTVFGQRASILLSVGDPAGWSAVDDIPECADGGPVAVKLELQRAYQDLGVAALGLGHPRRAEAFLARAASIQDQLDHPSGAFRLQTALACLDWTVGRWDGLESRTRELVDHTAGLPMLAFHNQIVLGCLLLSAGQLEESEACLASALDQGRGARSFLSIVTASAELARLHFVRGDARAALQLVDLPIELIRRKGVWVWATRLAPVATEALLACGEDRRARHFIDELALGLRGRDAPSARGALAFCRGAVDESQNRYRAAARSFGEAERCWNALPNPYQAGQAQEQRARCLLANDDRGGADVLIGAFETYERLGASWEAARVRAALRTHRVPLPYPWRGGRRAYGEELSPREAEVARLAGMGWTNREIAESLFLSPRTVQSHVASALRKRGVSSRRELSAIAAELAEAKNP